MSYIIYVSDTETTGMVPEENDIIEISFSRFTLEDSSNKEQKTWLLKALNPETIADEALAKNKHKKEDILHLTKVGKEKYMEPSLAVAEMESWIMDDLMSAHDRIILGQNIEFDVLMMKELWKRVGCENTFPFNVDNDNRIIDTKMLATIWDLCTGRRRMHYNLGTLVEAFNVKKRRAHRAEDDVAMTADLFVNMVSPIIPVIKQAFNDSYSSKDM